MTITPFDHEPTRYWVESVTQPGVVHLVDTDYEGKPACSCHDFMCRDRECKHIRALREKGIIKEAVSVSRPSKTYVLHAPKPLSHAVPPSESR